MKSVEQETSSKEVQPLTKQSTRGQETVPLGVNEIATNTANSLMKSLSVKENDDDSRQPQNGKQEAEDRKIMANKRIAAQSKKSQEAKAQTSNGQEKTKTTPLSHETIWKPLQIDQFNYQSPEWNPVLYPRPGIETDPPACTLRYDSPPTFHCSTEVFEEDVRNTVNNDIAKGFPKFNNMPRFAYEENGVTVPCRTEVKVYKDIHRAIVELSFDEYEQCAFYAQIKAFPVACRCCHSKHFLTLRKIGECHDPDLVAIEITPATKYLKGFNPSFLDTQLYIDTLLGLLKYRPAFELIGAWQLTTRWSDGHDNARPIVTVVVRRKANYKESDYSLHGFGNQLGNYIVKSRYATEA
jgi:hypothetical protein